MRSRLNHAKLHQYHQQVVHPNERKPIEPVFTVKKLISLVTMEDLVKDALEEVLEQLALTDTERKQNISEITMMSS